MKVEKLISNNPIDWLHTITEECLGYPIANLELSENSVAIDAGANVGGFALAWHNKFSRLYCIEASKSNYEQLVDNTTSISSKIQYFNRAVGKNDGEVLRLMKYTHDADQDTNSGNYGTISMVNKSNNHGWKESTGYEEVESISLETILSTIGTAIDLLKVDVEGSEYNFLYGKDLSSIRYITMELHNFLYASGEQQALVHHIAKTHNEVFSVGDGINNHFMKLWKRK